MIYVSIQAQLLTSAAYILPGFRLDLVLGFNLRSKETMEKKKLFSSFNLLQNLTRK